MHKGDLPGHSLADPPYQKRCSPSEGGSLEQSLVQDRALMRAVDRQRRIIAGGGARPVAQAVAAQRDQIRAVRTVAQS